VGECSEMRVGGAGGWGGSRLVRCRIRGSVRLTVGGGSYCGKGCPGRMVAEDLKGV